MIFGCFNDIVFVPFRLFRVFRGSKHDYIYLIHRESKTQESMPLSIDLGLDIQMYLFDLYGDKFTGYYPPVGGLITYRTFYETFPYQ